MQQLTEQVKIILAQKRVNAWMGPIALLYTFSLGNNVFALNFKTVCICKEKVVTGRNGADLKATETGEKETIMLRKEKGTVQETKRKEKSHVTILQRLHQSLNDVRLLPLRLTLFLFLIICIFCCVPYFDFFVCAGEPILLFVCFEDCRHHLLRFPSRALQRTSLIKGSDPGRMPLRANAGAIFARSSHVWLLSFPPVLSIQSFFEAKKGPDLLFGVMELEIMDRLQRTFSGQSSKPKYSE